MKLFEIDPETKEMRLTAEARGISPFKEIMKRLTKCKGDADGRKKIMNEKEILYAYFCATPYSGLRYASKEEQFKILKKRLNIDEGWQPDELVKEAIEVIIDSRKTESTHLLDSAVKLGKAIKKWYDTKAEEIEKNPNTFNPKMMGEFQEGFLDLGKTLEMIEGARAKVVAEYENRSTNKGRMMSKFETNDETEV